MKRVYFPQFGLFNSGAPALLTGCLLFVLSPFLRADQVRMQNGDQLFGRVVSLSGDTLTLQSEILGTLKLPRAKIAAVSFGTNAMPNLATQMMATNRQPLARVGARTNGTPELADTLRQLRTHSNLVSQVQAQFLAGAGPEANSKFNELLNGLTTGQLNIGDLRSQAQNAAAQLRAAKKELGGDAGGVLDSYLTILDSFINETTDQSGAETSSPKPKAPPAQDE
jgi:hypothetical protein